MKQDSLSLTHSQLADVYDNFVYKLISHFEGSNLFNEEICKYFNFSSRITNVFSYNNIVSFSDLLSLKYLDLLRLSNLGEISIYELLDFFQNLENMFQTSVSLVENEKSKINSITYFMNYLFKLKKRFEGFDIFFQDIVSESELSLRTKNSLKRESIVSLYSICSFDWNDISKITNFGQKSFRELREFLYKKYEVSNYSHSKSRILYDLVQCINEKNEQLNINDFFDVTPFPFKKYDVVNFEDLKRLHSEDSLYSDLDIIYNDAIFDQISKLNKPLELLIYELLLELIKSNDDKKIYVLNQRAKGRTLEDIASEFLLTRERIRQIESKAKTRIISKIGYETIIRYLNIYSNKQGFVMLDEISNIFQDLTPFFNYLYTGNICPEIGIFFFQKDKLKEIYQNFAGLPNAFLVEDFNLIAVNYDYPDIAKHVFNKTYFIYGLVAFKKRPTLADKYEYILRNFFDSFDIYDDQSINKFKELYRYLYEDEEINGYSAHSISSVMKRIPDFVAINRGEYSFKVAILSNELISRIINKVKIKESMLIAGLFYVFEVELGQFGIKNRYQLHDIIVRQIPQILCNRDYVWINQPSHRLQTDLICEFVKTIGRQFNLSEIQKSIPGVTEVGMSLYIENNEDLINIFGKRFLPVYCLKVTQKELELIRNRLHHYLGEHQLVTGQKIYLDILAYEFPDLLAVNEIDNAHFAFNFVKALFKKEFKFQNNTLTLLSSATVKPIDAVFQEFCQRKKFHVNELSNYSNSLKVSILNMKQFLDRFYENGFLRIDNNQVVKCEAIQLNPNIITEIENIVINNLIRKQLIAGDIENFDIFPKLTIEWNKHLLAHLIMKYSFRLKVETIGNQYNDLNYIIREKVYE